VRRLFWLTFGLGLGAVVGVTTVRWATRTAEKLTPQSLAERAVSLAADLRARLADALDEGRAAMAEREAELRAQFVEPGSGAR
jgi:hypothetical protein